MIKCQRKPNIAYRSAVAGQCLTSPHVEGRVDVRLVAAAEERCRRVAAAELQLPDGEHAPGHGGAARVRGRLVRGEVLTRET